jgi:hypothetical protein
MNVSHNKSEIRKKTRFAISLFIRYFGVPKFKKKLEKIEERELIKLVSEIPELREHFPKLYSPSSGDLSNSGNDLNINSKGIKKSKSITKINNLYNYGEKEKQNPPKTKVNNSKKKNNNTIEKENSNSNINEKKINNDNEKNNDNDDYKKDNLNNLNNNKEKKNIKSMNNNYCEHCQTKMKDGEVLANHWITNCKMFTQCEKCFMNLEVEKLNDHRSKECKFKDQYKLCKICNESFLKEEFNRHQKEKCSLKKGYKKCPLCHKDIDIINKNGFYIHLVKQKCKQQNRKE